MNTVTAKPRALSERERAKRVAARKEVQERIMALAERCGEITTRDVADELGVSTQTAWIKLCNLLRSGNLVQTGGSGHKGDPKRYGPLGRAVTAVTSGHAGAKTGVERRVVEALSELGRATAGQVQEATGVRRSAVPQILGALARRGVIRQVRSSNGGPARWEVVR